MIDADRNRLISSYDLWLFSEGSHLRPYEILGAHPCNIDNRQGTRFAVWAPNALAIWVIGDFNEWDSNADALAKDEASGVWFGFVPGACRGQRYQFRVRQQQGQDVIKADPYAFCTELRPGQASIIEGLQRLGKPASASVPFLSAKGPHDGAVSIYEVHLGSWRKKSLWRWLSYEELAIELVNYVADMGFTHIELLPVMEHPYDPSWGYQSLGIYAPTARYGSPAQFAKFVEAAHDRGLGVILDWTPSHFPNDTYGLVQFDGTALYEHLDPREGFHPDWRTLIFNLGRREVANYLLGNALFWIEQYGVDGLRVDAVASMLYRDYSRAEGAWIPNRWGGRENLESIDFLKQLNRRLHQHAPRAIRIAEESTAFPSVTTQHHDVDHDEGLGFDWKWNMGWMHDVLRYFSRDCLFRAHHQHDLTFGIMYAYSERFVLALSHDEVVHGKASLLVKMPGDLWQRFANLRCLYALMWSYPGKKLLFMGSEWGSPKEWHHDESLPWHLLAQDSHLGLQKFVRSLNRLYRDCPSLHQSDHDPKGFRWISHDDHASSVLAFLRINASREQSRMPQMHGDPMLVICNLTPTPRIRYRIGTPLHVDWKILLNSDELDFGGSGFGIQERRPGFAGGAYFRHQAIAWQGQSQSIEVDLPPLSVLYLVPAGHDARGLA
ncbi:MAG: 1,4-alpha-glucan branching protein GlgB [Betaproteobacteria bacterium]|nr:1,4-alpha-glucan branching protein GlgB [Betaproteobacteria bacterium]NBP35892.1 1,4-alpha-glucan branching protein GlgB [Betaproteobacteria bacterium]NBQ79177.1 1,4-alpha-glucan branching protein GlgB [Betaproteobacteria bacterium]NBQ95882.1 1,4-alpha-glucan branching protein GlgB [Betaproteobacteria bacterium]NBS39736.1 1,4-alpha-glucan branching protein GlgB [Betaproteobacteria bacterium]